MEYYFNYYSLRIKDKFFIIFIFVIYGKLLYLLFLAIFLSTIYEFYNLNKLVNIHSRVTGDKNLIHNICFWIRKESSENWKKWQKLRKNTKIWVLNLIFYQNSHQGRDSQLLSTLKGARYIKKFFG